MFLSCLRRLAEKTPDRRLFVPGGSERSVDLDRLGRSMKHLIEIITELEAKGAGFRSITENIDTTTSGGRLVFHLFGALAQFERDLIRERRQECVVLVKQQNQAAAAIVAVALVGTAVAVCANNYCGSAPHPTYRGNCQYDWQYDAAGRRCGDRSAYSRPGGW
jgi:hypothetical protein